jgi:hypothetical protein
MLDLAERRLNARARRAARSVGCMAIKSRWQVGHAGNQGRFQIINERTNAIEAGEHFDMTALQVIAWVNLVRGVSTAPASQSYARATPTATRADDRPTNHLAGC